MKRPDIDAICKRAEAATEGPWVQAHLDSNEVLTKSGDHSIRVLGRDLDSLWPPMLATAKFVGHARQDIPDLLAYVDELEREIPNPVVLRDIMREVRRFVDLAREGHQERFVTNRIMEAYDKSQEEPKSEKA